jgi:hypothetical protein
LTRVLKLTKPVVRVRYELEELAVDTAAQEQSTLAELLAPIVERARAGSTSGTGH